MALKIAVPRETVTGEKRVAMVPAVVDKLLKLGVEVQVQKGAGDGVRIPDSAWADKVTLVDDADSLYSNCDIVLGVQPPTDEQIAKMPASTVLISHVYAHREVAKVKALRDGKVTTFAMELVPRITRAQAMDALSSQASAAGYKAALMAAMHLERFFPMLTTAAGTIRPAKVLVIGAGVAGLQAIATARRLGAMVEAYDVRAAAAEQVESLGAKFLKADITADAEGGYARELNDEEKAAQQALLEKAISQADAIITTANIPGRPAPRIISAAMVGTMKAGSVIVDLAAETGGNCELTQAGENVVSGNTTIIGPVNLPSSLSEHASEMYARNIVNLLELLVEEGELKLDWEDEVVAGTVLTHDGEIRHAPSREAVEGA